MADQGTINWPGASGREYKHWIYPISGGCFQSHHSGILP